MPDVTAPATPAAADRCELFGAGGCDKQLPTNEVLEEYTFGQFVRLRYNAGDGVLRPIASSLPDATTRAYLSTMGATALQRAVSVSGLVSGKPEAFSQADVAMVPMLPRLETDSSIAPPAPPAPATGLPYIPAVVPIIVATYVPPPYVPPVSQTLDAYTVGLYLPWTQSWRLKGYSRGALAHSLTLGPQEEATIELFTWDRRKRSMEQSASFESDQSIEQSDSTKDVMDVVRELSSSNEFKIEGHARLNVKYAAVEAEVGASGSQIGKLNETAKRSTNHLQESTQKAAARVRVSRQTRISEASETGREERVTRKVRNPNMCRTLALNYFEVLAHYTVTTKFDQQNAQVCLFVQFPIGLRSKVFAERDLRTNERALRGALINPELSEGFVAARTLAAHAWAMTHVCDAPVCSQHQDVGMVAPAGATAPSRAALETAALAVANAIHTLRGSSVLPFCQAVVDRTEPDWGSALAMKRWGFLYLLGQNFGTVLNGLGNIAPAVSMNTMIPDLSRVVDAMPTADLQMIDMGQALPELNTPFEHIVWTIVSRLLSNQSVSVQGSAVGAVLSVSDRMKCTDPDDAGLVGALVAFQGALATYRRAETEAQGVSEDLQMLRSAQRQAQLDAEKDQVQSAFPLGDMANAAERVEALLAHLNAHPSHYRYALFQAMPIGDQMQQLAQAGLPTELVEPRVLGMVNGGAAGVDLLAVPINTALAPEWKQLRNLFIDQNPELIALTADREVRMPTPGVSIESRLGECDGCEEFIMESRKVELDARRVQIRAQEAAARHSELEADRLEARIKAGQLDAPTPGAGPIRVAIDKPVA